MQPPVDEPEVSEAFFDTACAFLQSRYGHDLAAADALVRSLLTDIRNKFPLMRSNGWHMTGQGITPGEPISFWY